MKLKPGLKKAGGNWDRKRLDNLHTPNPGYPEEHWVECQRCGFDFKESGTHHEWTGAIVCGGCFDYRQPQDFVRGRIDDIAARGLVRPPPPQDFFDLCSRRCIAGIALTGCAVAGVVEDGETSSSIGIQSGNPSDSDSSYSTFNITNTL